MTPLPLRFVDGDPEIAYGVVAYAAERPRALPGMPAPGEAELKRSGVVLVCFADDAGCRAAAARARPALPAAAPSKRRSCAIIGAGRASRGATAS